MPLAPFTFEEQLGLLLAAGRVRETIDDELGELMRAATLADTQEAWAKVNDRLNVLGRFDDADKIRATIRDAGR